MYKWRLLIFASFAVFQPIVSFTERNLIDGTQQCCDRSPYSLHRDTNLAVYGTYRANKFVPEYRQLNTRREISQNRRNGIKEFDTVFARSLERQGSHQREQLHFSPDRQARATLIERHRVGTFNIRDTRERTRPDDLDYRASPHRLSHDETSTHLSNERRSRVSIESERRVERMRDNTRNSQNEIRDLFHGTRNDVIRHGVANTRDGRRIAMRMDLDRRTYLSRTDIEINSRNRNFADRRVSEVDQYRLISLPGNHIAEKPKINGDSGNYRLDTRESRNNEHRLTLSRFDTRAQVGEINRRSFDRDVNQIYTTDSFGLQRSHNTRSEFEKLDDERRIARQENRRFVRNTNEIDRRMGTNRHQIDNERRVDQSKKDSSDRRTSRNYRHERRSLSEMDRQLERNVMGVERVASRSLDRRESTIPRGRRDMSIRRIREEPRNDARDVRQIILRTVQDTTRQLDGNRRSMSRKTNNVNNIRERQSLERLTSTNVYSRSRNAKETRDYTNVHTNIDSKDRRVARERMDHHRRVFRSLSNSRETLHPEQHITRRAEQNERFSESRVFKLTGQVRRIREETRLNLLNEVNEEHRSLNRIGIEKVNSPIEKENQRSNTRVSRDRTNSASLEIRIEQRAQRSLKNIRLADIRSRLENVANARLDNSEERRASPDTRLTESRLSTQTEIARARDSRLNQRNHYQTFQVVKARETVRNIQYKAKEQDTDRTIIGSRSRFSLSESTRNRITFATNEKVAAFTPFFLDWQCLFYTLQGIYIFGILVQMLNDNGSTNGKAKSFRWWRSSTRSIKID